MILVVYFLEHSVVHCAVNVLYCLDTASEVTVAGALTSQVTSSTTINTFTMAKTTTDSGADWRVPCELYYGGLLVYDLFSVTRMHCG